MKRFVSMLLAAIMCLSLCAYASAAGKDLQFDAQPSTQTVKAGGNCQFVIKCSNQKTITWHFVDPDTEEEITGKKLADHFADLNKTKKKAERLTVLNPNSKTITIKNVPEEMHGWKVYSTIGTTKNNQLNSDTVYILIKGMPVPDEAKEAASEDEEEPDEDEEEPAEDEEEPAEDEEEPFEDKEEPAEDEEEPAEDEEEPAEDEEEPAEDEEEPAKTEKKTSESKKEPAKEDKKDSITVKAVNALIYPVIDEQTSESGVTETTLPVHSSIEVYASKDPVCWRINGITVVLPEMTNHLTILFADDDLTIEALTAMPATPTDLDEDTSEDQEDEEEPSEEDEEEPAADEEEEDKDDKKEKSEEAEPSEDEEEEQEEEATKMCTVKCENCRFTGGDYQYVTTGEVPSGTIITVVATDGDTSKGYSINGGEYGGKGKSTVRIVVYEDSVISMQKRKGE